MVPGTSGGGGGAGTAGSSKNGGNGLDYSSIFGTGYGVSGVFAGGGGAGSFAVWGVTAGAGGTGGGGAGAANNGAGGNGVASSGGGGGGGAESNGTCGNGGSGIVLLSIGGTTNPYTTWASANAGGQTAGEDYDNDGVENGIEYFMGETGSSFTAMPGLDETNTITWPMDLNFEGTYEIQTSPDLGTWTNVDPRPLPSGGTLSYLLPTGLGKQFVRLLVTPTP